MPILELAFSFGSPWVSSSLWTTSSQMMVGGAGVPRRETLPWNKFNIDLPSWEEMASLSLHLPCLCSCIPAFREVYVTLLWLPSFVTSCFGSLPCSGCSSVLVVFLAVLWFPASVPSPPSSFCGSLLTAPGTCSVLVLSGWASSGKGIPQPRVHSKSPLGVFIVIYTFLRSGLWIRISFQTKTKRKSWKNSQRIFFQCRKPGFEDSPGFLLASCTCGSLLAQWSACAGQGVGDQPGQALR